MTTDRGLQAHNPRPPFDLVHLFDDEVVPEDTKRRCRHKSQQKRNKQLHTDLSRAALGHIYRIIAIIRTLGVPYVHSLAVARQTLSLARGPKMC